MNLVRLTFIAGMVGLAGFALNAAVQAPFHERVATVVATQMQCVWNGGQDNVGFIILGVVAIAGATAIAITDLVRRVY